MDSWRGSRSATNTVGNSLRYSSLEESPPGPCTVQHDPQLPKSPFTLASSSTVKASVFEVDWRCSQVSPHGSTSVSKGTRVVSNTSSVTGAERVATAMGLAMGSRRRKQVLSPLSMSLTACAGRSIEMSCSTDKPHVPKALNPGTVTETSPASAVDSALQHTVSFREKHCRGARTACQRGDSATSFRFGGATPTLSESPRLPPKPSTTQQASGWKCGEDSRLWQGNPACSIGMGLGPSSANPAVVPDHARTVHTSPSLSPVPMTKSPVISDNGIVCSLQERWPKKPRRGLFWDDGATTADPAMLTENHLRDEAARPDVSCSETSILQSFSPQPRLRGLRTEEIMCLEDPGGFHGSPGRPHELSPFPDARVSTGWQGATVPEEEPHQLSRSTRGGTPFQDDVTDSHTVAHVVGWVERDDKALIGVRSGIASPLEEGCDVAVISQSCGGIRNAKHIDNIEQRPCEGSHVQRKDRKPDLGVISDPQGEAPAQRPHTLPQLPTGTASSSLQHTSRTLPLGHPSPPSVPLGLPSTKRGIPAASEGLPCTSCSPQAASPELPCGTLLRFLADVAASGDGRGVCQCALTGMQDVDHRVESTPSPAACSGLQHLEGVTMSTESPDALLPAHGTARRVGISAETWASAGERKEVEKLIPSASHVTGNDGCRAMHAGFDPRHVSTSCSSPASCISATEFIERRHDPGLEMAAGLHPDDLPELVTDTALLPLDRHPFELLGTWAALLGPDIACGTVEARGHGTRSCDHRASFCDAAGAGQHQSEGQSNSNTSRASYTAGCPTGVAKKTKGARGKSQVVWYPPQGTEEPVGKGLAETACTAGQCDTLLQACGSESRSNSGWTENEQEEEGGMTDKRVDAEGPVGKEAGERTLLPHTRGNSDEMRESGTGTMEQLELRCFEHAGEAATGDFDRETALRSHTAAEIGAPARNVVSDEGAVSETEDLTDLSPMDDVAGPCSATQDLLRKLEALSSARVSVRRHVDEMHLALAVFRPRVSWLLEEEPARDQQETNIDCAQAVQPLQESACNQPLPCSNPREGSQGSVGHEQQGSPLPDPEYIELVVGPLLNKDTTSEGSSSALQSAVLLDITAVQNVQSTSTMDIVAPCVGGADVDASPWRASGCKVIASETAPGFRDGPQGRCTCYVIASPRSGPAVLQVQPWGVEEQATASEHAHERSAQYNAPERAVGDAHNGDMQCEPSAPRTLEEPFSCETELGADVPQIAWRERCTQRKDAEGSAAAWERGMEQPDQEVVGNSWEEEMGSPPDDHDNSSSIGGRSQLFGDATRSGQSDGGTGSVDISKADTGLLEAKCSLGGATSKVPEDVIEQPLSPATKSLGSRQGRPSKNKAKLRRTAMSPGAPLSPGGSPAQSPCGDFLAMVDITNTGRFSPSPGIPQIPEICTPSHLPSLDTQNSPEATRPKTMVPPQERASCNEWPRNIGSNPGSKAALVQSPFLAASQCDTPGPFVSKSSVSSRLDDDPSRKVEIVEDANGGSNEPPHHETVVSPSHKRQDLSIMQDWPSEVPDGPQRWPPTAGEMRTRSPQMSTAFSDNTELQFAGPREAVSGVIEPPICSFSRQGETLPEVAQRPPWTPPPVQPTRGRCGRYVTGSVQSSLQLSLSRSKVFVDDMLSHGAAEANATTCSSANGNYVLHNMATDLPPAETLDINNPASPTGTTEICAKDDGVLESRYRSCAEGDAVVEGLPRSSADINVPFGRSVSWGRKAECSEDQTDTCSPGKVRLSMADGLSIVEINAAGCSGSTLKASSINASELGPLAATKESSNPTSEPAPASQLSYRGPVLTWNLRGPDPVPIGITPKPGPWETPALPIKLEVPRPRPAPAPEARSCAPWGSTCRTDAQPMSKPRRWSRRQGHLASSKGKSGLFSGHRHIFH